MSLDFKKFKSLAEENYKVIPVYEEIINDFETPVSAYLKIKETKNTFLLESVEGPEKINRHSIIGINPVALISNKKKITSLDNLTSSKKQIFDFEFSGSLFEDLELVLERFRLPIEFSDLPIGLIGSFAYESINFIEKTLNLKTDPLFPEGIFFLTGDLLVFDHRFHRLKFITTVYLESQDHQNPEKLEKIYLAASRRIAELKNKLKHPCQAEYLLELAGNRVLQSREASFFKGWESNFTKANFLKTVEEAKDHIKAGSAFQIVLSQRLTRNFDKEIDLLRIYRLLRIVNPSPYLFLLNFEKFQIIGSSPETLTRTLYDQKSGITEAFSRPIAGTYKRGKNEKEDQLFSEQLKKDPKELAEHLMLVDLARNDLGRVGIPGTVKANKLMFVEKYSHVLHLVSEIKTSLKARTSSIDLIKAVFPHGTLSGAPKVRAMQIISDLERKTPRAFYAGSVGIISFASQICNLAITIRSLLIEKRKITLQSGCGIVYDSDPLAEYQETLNKAAALIEVVETVANLEVC